MRAFLVSGLVVVLVFLVAVAHGLLSTEPARGSFVIEPGREGEVLRLVEPLRSEGFAGWAVGDVSISGPEIRVALRGESRAEMGAGTVSSCPGPAWVEQPGGLLLTFDARAGDRLSVEAAGERGLATREGITLAWFLCDEGRASRARVGASAERMISRLASRHHGGIWGQTLGARARTSGALGVVTRAVALTGLAPGVLVVLALSLGLLSSIGAAVVVLRRPVGAAEAARPPTSTERARAAGPMALLALVAAVLLAGAVYRAHLASVTPLDGDEVWAFPLPSPVFDDDHDAAVHPPLFRTAQQAYVGAFGWRQGDPLWALRLPSTAAAILALALVAVTIWLRGGPLPATVPLAVIAAAPPVVEAAALARPYALAALFVTLTIAALWSRLSEDAPEPPSVAGLRWLLALVGLGLAAWTDFLAGGAAAVVVGARLVEHRLAKRLDWWATAAVGVAALTWWIALLPGALDAFDEQVHPEPRLEATSTGTQPTSSSGEDLSGSGPDLRPGGGMGAGSVIESSTAIVGLGVLGHPGAGSSGMVLGGMVLVLLVVASVRRRSTVGLVPVLLVAGLVVASTFVALRPRNALFLPHVTLLAVGLLLAEVGAILRRCRKAALTAWRGGRRRRGG